MLITILATVVVLGVLIFVHELGHFIAAKAVDIEVPRFSIGLGPKLIGFRRGETEYVLSWLPLGGYVKMAGMEEMETIEGGPDKKPVVTGAATTVDLGMEVEDKRQAGPRDFESKSLPARTLVISAGVIMNLLFAFVVFAAAALIWGVRATPEAQIGTVHEELLPRGAHQLARLPLGTRITSVGGHSVEDFRDLEIALAKVSSGPLEFRFENHRPITINLPAGDTVRSNLLAAFDPFVNTPPEIGEVSRNSPAARAGLRSGDRVIAAAGEQVRTWQQLASIVERHPGQPVALLVERSDSQLPLTVTPETRSLHDELTYGRIGIGYAVSPESVMPRERPGVIGSLVYGVRHTWDVIALTVGFIKDLFTGGASPRNLGGPILIGQISGQVARLGMEAFLTFMALFSVNLAILNLLPIPVLDGGHLMFLGVEAVRGRALSLEQRMRWSQVGFVIVIAIMVWALANDVLRLFGM